MSKTPTTTERLAELVRALNATSWSSWQSIARFWPALEAAEAALADERIRNTAHELLAALHGMLALDTELSQRGRDDDDEDCAEVVAARAAIAKATGEQQ